MGVSCDITITSEGTILRDLLPEGIKSLKSVPLPYMVISTSI